MRQPPSTLVALVVRLARSEPAPGSENSWHQIISPRNVGGRNRCFCSSVPNATIDGMIHAAIPTLGRLTRPAGNSWAMMICSIGFAARPHGLGRCGCTQPPSAIAAVRSALGIAFSAATSARISSRSFSVSGSRSMSMPRMPGRGRGVDDALRVVGGPAEARRQGQRATVVDVGVVLPGEADAAVHLDAVLGAAAARRRAPAWRPRRRRTRRARRQRRQRCALARLVDGAGGVPHRGGGPFGGRRSSRRTCA